MSPETSAQRHAALESFQSLLDGHENLQLVQSPKCEQY